MNARLDCIVINSTYTPGGVCSWNPYLLGNNKGVQALTLKIGTNGWLHFFRWNNSSSSQEIHDSITHAVNKTKNMKKAITLLFSVLIGTVAMGQQKSIKTGTYSPRIKAFDLIFENGGKYHYYYDEYDNQVLHGKKSGKGTRNVNNGSEKGSISYSEEMNYKNGKLDGPLFFDMKVSMSQRGKTVMDLDVHISGIYKEGLPHGEWKINHKCLNKLNGQTQLGHVNTEAQYKYINGSIEKYKLTFITNGTSSVSGNCEANKNKSGTWNIQSEKILVKNGIKKGYFIGGQGVEREVDEEQRLIIEQLVKADGNYDKEDLLSKGYVLEERTETIDGNSIYRGAGPCDLFELNVASRFNINYYVLKRVKVSSSVKEHTSALPAITENGVEPFLLGQSFKNIPSKGSFYDSIEWTKTYEIGIGDHCMELDEEEYKDFEKRFEKDEYEFFGVSSKAVVVSEKDTLLIAECSESGIIESLKIISDKLSLANGVHVGLSSKELFSKYNASFLTTDCFAGESWQAYHIPGLSKNITLRVFERGSDGAKWFNSVFDDMEPDADKSTKIKKEGEDGESSLYKIPLQYVKNCTIGVIDIRKGGIEMLSIKD